MGTLLVLTLTRCDQPPAGPRARPANVLLIVTDDQRRGLPMMDETKRWFVEGGRRYPNAYTTVPVCCPARAGMFTGLYAHNHRVLTNFDADRMDASSTFQADLDAEGYTSAIFGKYMNEVDASPPHFDSWSTHIEAPRYYGTWNVDGEHEVVDTYSTDYIADQAVAFLRDAEANDDRPWLVYLPVMAPHNPFTLPRRYVGAPVSPWRDPPPIERDRRDKPAWVRHHDATRADGAEMRRRTIRALMPVDDLVGRVLRTVDALGEDEGTLAIFTSDNGRMWSEHGLQAKQVPYPASVRVPLAIRWPARIAAGSIDRRLVTNVDIAPTILDAAAIDYADARFDGRSLLDRSWRRDHVLIEFFHQEGRPGPPTWASLQGATFQYTEYFTNDGDGVAFREYYDAASDPRQLHNLLGDANGANDPPRARVTRLATLLDRARACRGSACP